MQANGNSITHITGGSLSDGWLYLLDDGALDVYGTNLKLTAAQAFTFSGRQGTRSLLSGTLADGMPLDVQVFDQNGGVGQQRFAGGVCIGGTEILPSAAPEPAALALLAAVGSACLARCRRQPPAGPSLRNEPETG